MIAKNRNFGPTLAQRLAPSIERQFELKDAIFQGMRVALPGVVQSFNAGPPATVTVQVATKETVQFNPGGPDAPVAVEAQSMYLPLLTDVPVVFPSAGGWSMTFPIAAGDECLLVFSDTAIDVWLQNGGIENDPITSRRHSLSDAIAIFGLRSTPRGLSGYSTSSAQLRSDDGSVSIDLATGAITFKATNVVVDGATQVNDKFACNSATPQASVTANAALPSTPPTNVGPWGFTTAVQVTNLVALVNQIRAALVANGIMA